MPANRFNGFTDYGVGIGLRIPHYNHILEKKPVCDWFEIISENFMVDGGRPLYVLDQILEQYRVVQHGVSMYFGSAEPLNREHLRRLKTLVQRTKTPWLSDHLCWGSVDGTYSHDLLPMPYTFEAAKKTAQKIREARDFLEVPIVVENVSSYAEFHVVGDDGVGVPHRSGGAGRLRHSARREQHLCLVAEPQLRSVRVPEQRAARPRGADSHRRPLEVREVHSRHARPSGDRSGVETVCARHRVGRADGHACWSGTTTFRRSTKFMARR